MAHILIISAAILGILAFTIFLFWYKASLKRANNRLLTIDMAEKIIESAPDIIYVLDRTYKILQIFNYNADKVSKSLEELIGNSAEQFIDSVHVEKLKVEIEKAFNDDETHEVFYTTTCDDSILYFTGYFKRIKEGLVICRERNITQAKLHEQNLIQAKEDIENIQKVNQLILDHSNSGLVYIDKNFTVQFENLHTTFQEATHLEYEKGKYCYQRVKGRSTPCPDCVAQKAIDNRRVEKDDLVINENLIFEITASPIINSDGSTNGVVMKYENITIKEKTVQALLQAKEAAEISDKLKSKFLSNVSHEIRTPLNSIIGFSDLLMHTDDPEEKEEYISIIKRNNDLLLQLINDILDLSRIESDAIEVVFSEININQLFTALEASANLRVADNPDLSIIFNAPSENYIINSEENRILQVLSNFINNSIKFTEKGSITIGYDIRQKDIRFYVTDTGKGIPQDKIADIFKRFVKLNDFAVGTGLGLSICQTIVEKLGGEIGVESTLEEGSTFWFTLPIKPINIHKP